MVYIGPYNSGAAKISMPILNEAGLLQVSPAVTWPGLTKKVEGGDPDEPDIYRPTGKITFCRVCPADDIQGPLAADFAKDQETEGRRRSTSSTTRNCTGRASPGCSSGAARSSASKILGHESIDATQNEFQLADDQDQGHEPGPGLLRRHDAEQGRADRQGHGRTPGSTCPLMVPGRVLRAGVHRGGRGGEPQELLRHDRRHRPDRADRARAPSSSRSTRRSTSNDPEAYAVYGYEAAKVVLEAIKKVGKKDREAIRKAVLATKDFDKGALGKWSFDENGDTTLQNMTISKVEDGKFKPVKIVDRATSRMGAARAHATGGSSPPVCRSNGAGR